MKGNGLILALLVGLVAGKVLAEGSVREFRNPARGSAGVFVAPTNSAIRFQGALFIKTLEDGGVECRRFPDDVLRAFPPKKPKPGEAWGGKARTTTGVKMFFKTDSRKVLLHFRVPEGFVDRGANWLVLQDGRPWKKFDFSAKQREMELKLESASPGRPMLYTVVYPSWADPVFYGMELDKGARLQSFTLPKRPLYVAYGDSVSHGTGQKSASYLTWPYQLAEKLGCDYYSLAVGGAKIMLPAVECFKYFKKVDLVTFYLGINDAAVKSPEEYARDYDAALGVIRKYQPDAKIFCITIHTLPEDKVGKFTKTPLAAYRQPVRDVVAARQKAGDKNLFLVEGTTLAGLEDAMNPGNVHLGVDGAKRWADRLYEVIAPKMR